MARDTLYRCLVHSSKLDASILAVYYDGKGEGALGIVKNMPDAENACWFSKGDADKRDA